MTTSDHWHVGYEDGRHDRPRYALLVFNVVTTRTPPVRSTGTTRGRSRVRAISGRHGDGGA